MNKNRILIGLSESPATKIGKQDFAISPCHAIQTWGEA